MAFFNRRQPSFTLLAVLFWLALIPTVGCQNSRPDSEEQESAEPRTSDAQPITVVILDSTPEIMEAWTTAIDREFQSLELGAVRFEFATGREFLAEPIEGDLVFYPPYLLGDLLQGRLIRRIPDFLTQSEAYAANDVLNRQRRIFGVHDETRYAVSLGISSFFLLARTDILQQNGLTVPRTWREYQVTCQKLAELQQQGTLQGMVVSESWSPTLEPFHPDWLATNFYARSASYTRKRGRYSVLFDYSTWEPLIATPPFARALEELTTVFQLTAPAHRTLQPREIEQAFLRGESVLAITWPHPPTDAEAPSDPPAFEAGIFELPGSTSKYDSSTDSWIDAPGDEQQVSMIGVGGYCGSVLSSSKQSGVALRRLGLLAGQEFSQRLGPLNPALFPSRASHLGKLESWVAPRYGSRAVQQFADLIEQQNQSLIWMVRPRIEKATRYEAELTQVISDCLNGQPIPQPLEKVEQAWQKINADVDRKFQETISLEGLGIR